ncbi:hypothetical protein RZS28_03600 [Methylocapsa polymorpha]|uniref:Cytochrome c domain-containing protein n=1 Tax=Methylocapsa polymorpha TaxID=3080828 RepID=A0ABZ0HVM1_9HYPH|nr:hypothetical protein RZS28_03600 [Methylocapsa sp. RX1]
MARLSSLGGAAALLLSMMLLTSCDSSPQSGHVLDEAKLAGRQAATFPQADEDYFRDMDNGVALTPDEVKGRNMWVVWTGGNDRFWDTMTTATFGGFDLLKIISSHPSLKSDRESRWSWLGLVNEPCFDKAAGPDPNRFGLWLDVRSKNCPADPFENEKKYPGVAIGARGKQIAKDVTLPVGSYFGYATGIVGLRLFPNPDFDESAAKNWDAEKYYTDEKYYNDPKLVRPYRVGMSCGFCHVGPSPIHPPADPRHPQWAELNSTVGAQYMWVDRLFIYGADPKNFMYQLVKTYRPGAMDTSLVSTDYINNPRTMNAFYSLLPRLGVAKRWGKETLAGGELNNKQLNDYSSAPALTQFFEKPDTVWTPHVLKDGSDAVGALGALNRVYLNIGLFSEEWLLHFNPVAGGKPITPIEIAVAEKNSAYWQATEAGTFDMAQFFLKAGQPDHLKDAPGGDKYLTADAATLARGKTVFAETCARCHSSKLPEKVAGLDPSGCAGPDYLACWKRYWNYTKTDEFKSEMRKIVSAPDFLDGNYLSTDVRIPATLLRTNACSPLATNALGGNIWDNFSSKSYKELPSIGTITVQDPFTGELKPYKMPANGRGYTRVPSLISIWSTAPFLLNNSLGPFDESPSVDARMNVFQASIEQLLWPEKRERDKLLGDKAAGAIDRTTARSWINIPGGYIAVPEPFDQLQSALHRTLHRWLPGLFATGGEVTLGPIPKGTPVNLLANIRVLAETDDPAQKVRHDADLLDFVLKLKADVLPLPADVSDDELQQKFANLKEPMLRLSKCPDFVVNRGHYFGTAEFNNVEGLSDDEKSFAPEPALSDDDKRALIEFLKTF